MLNELETAMTITKPAQRFHNVDAASEVEKQSSGDAACLPELMIVQVMPVGSLLRGGR